jgi:hypothetical protein
MTDTEKRFVISSRTDPEDADDSVQPFGLSRAFRASQLG